MNGEVKSYDFGKIVPWDTFTTFPNDLQQKYLDMISAKFPGVPIVAIGEAMGVDPNHYSPYFVRHGLRVKKVAGGPIHRTTFYKSEVGKRWLDWVNQGCVDVAEETEEPKEVRMDSKDCEPIKVEEKIVEKPVEKTEERISVNAVGVNNISVLLQALVGTGAKVTIEFVL